MCFWDYAIQTATHHKNLAAKRWYDNKDVYVLSNVYGGDKTRFVGKLMERQNPIYDVLGEHAPRILSVTTRTPLPTSKSIMTYSCTCVGFLCFCTLVDVDIQSADLAH